MKDNNINKSKLGNMKIIDSNINDINSINDSYNTTNIYNNHYEQYNFNPEVDSIKNSNNRTLLKSLVGKPITIWAYAIDEYSRIKSKQLVRYTIINVHNQNQYIADHIQLGIPYEIYDENIRHKIILVNGWVYEYDDKNSNEKKQSILAKEICISSANDFYIAKDFIKPINNITSEQIEQSAVKYASSFSPNQKFKLLENYIHELNELLPSMRKNFISDYIINQYMINYDPELMNLGNLSILRNKPNAITEITFLIMSVIKRISEGMNNLNDVFNYINWILNDMQGLNEDELYNDNVVKMRAPSKLVKFCKDNNLNLNIKKAYKFIKERNKDFHPGVLNKNEAYIDALQILYINTIKSQNNIEQIIKSIK